MSLLYLQAALKPVAQSMNSCCSSRYCFDDCCRPFFAFLVKNNYYDNSLLSPTLLHTHNLNHSVPVCSAHVWTIPLSREVNTEAVTNGTYRWTMRSTTAPPLTNTSLSSMIRPEVLLRVRSLYWLTKRSNISLVGNKEIMWQKDTFALRKRRSTTRRGRIWRRLKFLISFERVLCFHKTFTNQASLMSGTERSRREKSHSSPLPFYINPSTCWHPPPTKTEEIWSNLSSYTPF